ncbi:hypothetical protein BJ508DRAFT_331648 [Ascobolus immersus RN42]|uniref:Uncharacterized protein n=1 Tax=Ascobolus immersus RN42 TaxID=1160509 RepID=A0A3N4HQ44_ASCIM|nr:hypothetical protein BJ508DRAFT_331648 [Ascobolus immersus RN42]
MVHVDGHEDSREFEDALFPRSGATSLNSSFSSSLLAREREAFSFGSDLKASELAQSLGSEDTTLRLSTLPVVPQGEELRTWEEALSSAHANTPSEEETPQIIPTTISPSLLHVSFDNQSALPIPIPAVTAETAQAADEARVMPPPSSSHTRRK